MVRILVAFALALVALPAQAASQALDPMNRLHLGASMSDARTVGFSGGLDSRLTRLVFVDVGLFASPIQYPVVKFRSQDAADYIFLRHGLYVAPGLRIPHRERGAFSWDFVTRGGFAGVWSADTNPENFVPTGGGRYEVEADPSLLFGADFQVRHESIGLRVGGKGFVFSVYDQVTATDLVVLKPQYFGEAFYQW